MITDLYDYQLESTYERFAALLGGKPWLKVTQDHKHQISANPLSQVQLSREFRVAYGLALFEQKGMALQGTDDWPDVLHGLTFAAQACELADNGIDGDSLHSFVGRVRGAFSNAADMRALRFEMLTAVALFKQGARIHWPDDSTGPETYDLLVTSPDGLEFEVECKSISADKGKPIAEQDAHEFFNRLLRKLPTTQNAGELLLLQIQVPKRLPKAHSALDQLVSDVVMALTSGTGQTAGEVVVTQRILRPSFLQAPLSVDQIPIELADLFGRSDVQIVGHHAVAFNDRVKSAISIEVLSSQEARVLEAMRDTAKHAVRKQMTGKRPGCLVLRLESESRASLLQTVSEDINPLAHFATKLLIDPKHQHLACVAFLSDSDLISLSESTRTEQSVSYVVDQQVGPNTGQGIGMLLRGELPR